jgi:hypothetical protein
VGLAPGVSLDVVTVGWHWHAERVAHTRISKKPSKPEPILSAVTADILEQDQRQVPVASIPILLSSSSSAVRGTFHTR